MLAMATSTESLQARLLKTMRNDFDTLRPEDFPSHLVAQIRQIHAATTKIPSEAGGSEGSLKATINAMSNDDARFLIEKIAMLFEDVLQHYHREQFESRRSS
jgi:hypothetical protein